MQKISNAMQITGGEYHLSILCADGSVWSVGYNGYGQFGDGTADTQYLPKQMKDTDGSELYNAKKVSAGRYHTVVLKQDGTVIASGYNGNGQLGIGNTSTKYLPQDMLESLAVTDEEGNVTEPAKKVQNIKDISANGDMAMLSIKKDKDGKAGMYVAGQNNFGQLYTKNTQNKYLMTKVQEDKDIITMAATRNVSAQTSVIADNLGLVYTVGYNANGEMGDETVYSSINPTSISDATFEVENQRITLKLGEKEEEQINAWTDLGFNLLYNIVEGEELQYKSIDLVIAEVNAEGIVKAKSFGKTRIEVTTNKLPNKAVITVEVLRKNDKAYPKVVSGRDHTVALKADGTVWTWGYNGNGQLGTGDTQNRYKPTKINIENIIDVAIGAHEG